MGWFFGFKLHLICNEKGELLNFMITPGGIDGLSGNLVGISINIGSMEIMAKWMKRKVMSI